MSRRTDPALPWAAVLAGLLVAAAVAAAQERPLPDPEVFLRETRKHLQTDSSLQSSYTYTETRREQKLDSQGRVTDESVTIVESYPGLPGERGRWERVIVENGKPVSAAKLAAQDRDRQRKAQELAERLASRPQQEHARQVRDWEKHVGEQAERVEDIFRVFEIRMLGRERIDGHDTIAFSMTPRAGADPRTREGRIMRHFTVRAWVSEADHQLVKLDAEAIDTVSFGLGLLARMHKGARVSFERRRVNGEVWLPAVASYSGSARVALVKVLRRGAVSEYSDYRKFDVNTAFTYSPPDDQP